MEQITEEKYYGRYVYIYIFDKKTFTTTTVTMKQAQNSITRKRIRVSIRFSIQRPVFATGESFPRVLGNKFSSGWKA